MCWLEQSYNSKITGWLVRFWRRGGSSKRGKDKNYDMVIPNILVFCAEVRVFEFPWFEKLLQINMLADSIKVN
jgi:hypothetical protein